MATIADRLEVLDDNTLAIVSEVTTDELRQLADHCERVRNTGHVKASDMTPIASAPEWVCRDFCNRKGIDYSRQFLATGEYDIEFLNSPEMAAFRYWKGRL